MKTEKTTDTAKPEGDLVMLAMAPLARGHRLAAYLMHTGGIRYAIEQHEPNSRNAAATASRPISREDAQTIVTLSQLGVAR